MSTKVTELEQGVDAPQRYIVDVTETPVPGAIVYKTLEALRLGVAERWTAGDTVEIKNSDSTLTDKLNFGNVPVTLKGYGIISPNRKSKRFADMKDVLTVASEDGKALEFVRFDLGNLKDESGAAISANNVFIVGGNNKFSGNCASKNGGAINCDYVFSISGGTNSFTENKASLNCLESEDGGAIASGNYVNITGGNNKFSGNKADSGGAISGRYVNLKGGINTFDGNIAERHGGAISAEIIYLDGNKNLFRNNMATSGGAIAGDNINFIGGENSFEGNRAKGSGG